MIMIDERKTVIAGDAAKIITELATVIDRLIHEIVSKDGAKITYDELQDRFNTIIKEVKKVRGDNDDINPNELIASGKIREILPEEFFDMGSNINGSGPVDKIDATSLLQEALKKLGKARDKDKPSKKTKSKKNKK